MRRLGLSVRLGLVYIGMDYSENIVISRINWIFGHWLHYGRLVGVPFRGEDGQDEVR